MLLYLILIIVCILCHLCIGEDSRPLIKPSQLMVGTVLDMTSSEITRDAFNMIKTIRIFGGSLNIATILVGLTGDGSSTLDNTILPTLAALDVQVMFIPQSPPHLAKTLNKFRLFEAFDSIKYDYFLWLDADIVAFEDPMPYLHMHMYPGSIECVPDFYSYLQRYPSVNRSSEYWNPNQPSFQLLGAGETAPHGICNTGVLYFDALSLSKFLTGLQSILSNTTYMALHGKDRFIDSLIFTHIVNSLEIEVTTLPYALNYMALFEIEIQEELVNPHIVLAHMLSDTELYCDITTSEQNENNPDPTLPSQCACLYRNKLMSPKGSLLRDVIQNKILNDPQVCATLAGKRLPSLWLGQTHIVSFDSNTIVIGLRSATSELGISSSGGDSHQQEGSQNDVIEGAQDPRIQCELVSPPMQGAVYHITSRNLLHVDVTIRCLKPADSSPISTDITLVSKNRIINSMNVEESKQSDVVHFTADVPMLIWANSSTDFMDFSYTLHMRAPSTPTRGPNYKANFMLEVSVMAHNFTTANLTVLYDILIPPGQVHYSNNALMSPKPALLESQLFLADYLNDRGMRGTGIAVCCQSRKGLTVVENIISTWNGEDLLIVIESADSLVQSYLSGEIVSEKERIFHLENAGQRLNNACNQRNTNIEKNHLNCYIVVPSLAEGTLRIPTSLVLFNRRIGLSLRPNSAQFVYIDFHAPHPREQAAILEMWMQVLRKNGIIMGSRLAPSHRSTVDLYSSQVSAASCSSSFSSYSARSRGNRVLEWESRRQSIYAVALAASIGQSLLVTYAERNPAYCDAYSHLYSHSQHMDSFGNSDTSNDRKGQGGDNWASAEGWAVWECSPAWYMHKLRA